MLRKIYLSPAGYLISLLMHAMAFIGKPFMVYGYLNRPDGKFRKHTRIGSTAILDDKKNIDIADHVWIGHYCLLDGIGSIMVSEGVNVASHTCIYTHSSQDALRILGKKYIEIPAEQRPGYIIEAVHIGDYTFIGTSSVLLPGTRLGKGCIVGAGSVVKGTFPDFSIVAGVPARIVGDSRTADKKHYAAGVDLAGYFDDETLRSFQSVDTKDKK